MLTKIRKMSRREEGFTLIELMVVILIIGILMAIAIPSFIAVRNRGYASTAKSIRSTAVKTMELYGTDNNGDYSGATAAGLGALEKSIPFLDAAPGAADFKSAGMTGLAADAYTITVNGRDGNTYTAVKAAGAAVVYQTNGVAE